MILLTALNSVCVDRSDYFHSTVSFTVVLRLYLNPNTIRTTSVTSNIRNSINDQIPDRDFTYNIRSNCQIQ